MRLQSAIFDMDGVLLDSMPMWRNLLNDFLHSQGRIPKGNLWDEIRPLTVLDTAVYLRDAYKLRQSEQEIERMINQRIEAFYQTEVQAKAGVEKFLALLKMEGVWMYRHGDSYYLTLLVIWSYQVDIYFINISIIIFLMYLIEIYILCSF